MSLLALGLAGDPGSGLARALLAGLDMHRYDRLSAMDAAFLGIETPSSHMHVGAVARFGPGPLVAATGGLDIEAIRTAVAAAVAGEPRFRQRLARVRVAGHWAWVDDSQFNLHFHLRHTRLPEPGDDRQLKRLAGRIFSQRLDRDHPLWEMWFVEGVSGGGFAIIAKVHHCLVDGIGGARLLGALLAAPAARPLMPSLDGQPGAMALTMAEIRHRLDGIVRAGRAVRAALRSPGTSIQSGWNTLTSMAAALRDVATPASPTWINPRHIGPHRRFDWTQIDLRRVRVIRERLGGTVNDVVLATVAGAIRRYLQRHGDVVDDLDDVRALVPVSIRPAGVAGGNAIATMLVPLPVATGEASARHEAVCAATRRLKSEPWQVESATLLEELADATSARPLAASLRVAAWLRAYNVVVTNVPGPPIRLALLGSPLEALYPMAPLFETQSIGVALFGYAGALCFGVSCDWHRVPDLHDFVADLDASFAELEAAAIAHRA